MLWHPAGVGSLPHGSLGLTRDSSVPLLTACVFIQFFCFVFGMMPHAGDTSVSPQPCCPWKPVSEVHHCLSVSLLFLQCLYFSVFCNRFVLSPFLLQLSGPVCIYLLLSSLLSLSLPSVVDLCHSLLWFVPVPQTTLMYMLTVTFFFMAFRWGDSVLDIELTTVLSVLSHTPSPFHLTPHPSIPLL